MSRNHIIRHTSFHFHLFMRFAIQIRSLHHIHVNQIYFLLASQLPSTNNKTGNKIKSRSFESFCTILSPDLALTSFLRGIFGQPILNEGTIFTFSMTNCGTYFCILTDLLALPLWSQFPLIFAKLFHIAMHC